MYEMMIDLETLDTRPSAIVLSVGAVVWQTHTLDGELGIILTYDTVDRFLRKPSIEPQTMAMRTMSESTLLWWQRQDPTARAEAFDPVRQDIETVFTDLMLFAKAYEVNRFWASPATFDFPIIEGLAENFGLGVPWSYRQKYDVRTVVLEANYSASDHEAPGVRGIPHTPVFDCEWQIDLLTAARAKLGRRIGAK